ncbi:MAG TPA: metallophosphoesterase [Mucilaginibacter sp.]|nr:metallophosphoesterase [Mucilaginibacter sp.]
MPSTQRNPRTRPVFKLSAIDDQEKFKPVPPAPGKYPYRLDINDLIPDLPENELIFHVAGDTGGTRSPEYQKSVIDEMILQCGETSGSKRPQFLFHLGDVVYNFGQASGYYDQFFKPYRDYPLPIFAIPGNHDADVNPLDKDQHRSLEAFEAVFCDTESRPLKLAGDTGRKTNIQPNFFWVLETPMANIIGLYSNVPKFGNIQKDQRDWFIDALKTSAANKKAIIVCLHHAPYSSDINHGSSIHMQAIMDGAAREAKVIPDLVLSGHVHNYQRFHKYYPGKTVPFIVAGGGGYADLHPIADPADPNFSDDSCLLDGIELQNYCDDAHGFLKIGISKKLGKITIDGEYFIASETGRLPFDTFTVTVRK